jgi:hypothetical protein
VLIVGMAAFLPKKLKTQMAQDSCHLG